MYDITRRNISAPTPRLTTDGRLDDDQKPSTAAAMKSMTAAPSTTVTTLCAVAWSDAMRVLSPGATIDQPSDSPAPPASTMAPSSSEPWPTTNVRMLSPAPLAATYPMMAPVTSPFSTR